MADRLALAYDIISNLGLRAGIKFLRSRAQGSLDGGIFEIHSLGYSQPIFYRKTASDIRVLIQVLVRKEYEVRLTRAPETILDAGANIGLSTVFFANKFPRARIISIEPDRNSFEILSKNTEGYPNVTCVNAGLWHTPAMLNVVENARGAWATTVKEADSDSATAVRGTTIPEMMSEYNLAQLDLVKMDIEGSEKGLFENTYESWLAVTNHLIVEPHDNIIPGCTEAILRATRRLNFKMRRSGEHLIFTRGY